MVGEPQPLVVGAEPPALHRANGSSPPGGTPARDAPPGRKRKRNAVQTAPRRKTSERFAVLNCFVDAGMAELSRAELATWLVLYRDTRDETACASEASIAARVGCSKRAVTTALGRLRQRGLLIQVFKGGINRGPSRYRVVPSPKPPRELGKRASL